jgi:hypothetical protein
MNDDELAKYMSVSAAQVRRWSLEYRSMVERNAEGEAPSYGFSNASEWIAHYGPPHFGLPPGEHEKWRILFHSSSDPCR